MLKCIAVVLVAAVLLPGCLGTGSMDVNKMLEQYYSQERTYTPIMVEGVQSVTLTGENLTFTVETPLIPLSVTKNADVMETIVEGVTRLGQGYLIGEGVKTLSSTRDPVIVHTPE